MTIKNMQLTGTFDNNSAAFMAQSALFASTVQMVLANMSHVSNLEVRPQAARRVANGIPAVRQAIIIIPTTGDVTQDKINGTNVGVTSVSSAFKTAVGASLQIQTGSPSSLLDLSSSLERPINQNPPGLIITNQSNLNIVLLSIDEGTSIYSVVTNVGVADTASVAQDVIISVADTINYGVRVTPLSGQWKVDVTDIRSDATTVERICDGITETVDVKLNTVSVGTLISSGVLSGLIDLFNRVQFNEHHVSLATGGGYKAKDVIITPSDITSATGTITFKNNTGAGISSGVQVAYLYGDGSQIADA